MKGKHISKASQRRLAKSKTDYTKLTICQLIDLWDKGDRKAKTQIRIICGIS